MRMWMWMWSEEGLDLGSWILDFGVCERAFVDVFLLWSFGSVHACMDGKREMGNAYAL